MRAISATAVLIAIACCFSTALFGQRVEKEGKAWLAAHADPAEINVDGTWLAAKWGTVDLHQTQGSPDVKGRGDEWDISGAVSGTKLFLLFSDKGKVVYSAELSPDGPDAFAGHYTEGLPSARSFMRLIHLSRRIESRSGSTGAPADPARIVVYRKGGYRGSLVKPSVYCDDREVAYMYSGEFFTVTLAPGNHTISSSDEQTSVSLDAQPGARYYIRVGLGKDGGFSVESVDSVVGLKELKSLKPAGARHITQPDIVSTAPLPKN